MRGLRGRHRGVRPLKYSIEENRPSRLETHSFRPCAADSTLPSQVKASVSIQQEHSCGANRNGRENCARQYHENEGTVDDASSSSCHNEMSEGYR